MIETGLQKPLQPYRVAMVFGFSKDWLCDSSTSSNGVTTTLYSDSGKNVVNKAIPVKSVTRQHILGSL